MARAGPEPERLGHLFTRQFNGHGGIPAPICNRDDILVVYRGLDKASNGHKGGPAQKRRECSETR